MGRIGAADGWSVAALAELMTGAFEGYVVPVTMTESTLARKIRAEAIDLSLGLVGIVHGQPAGLALVAARGDRRRVAAMGVTVAHRRTGLGRRLIRRIVERSVEEGCRSLTLEVIRGNRPAERLYETEGFVEVRTLVGWERPAGRSSDGTPLAPCELVEVARAIARDPVRDLPWQLAAETVAAQTAPTRALKLGDEGFVVVNDASAELVSLGSLFVPPDRRRHGVGRTLVSAVAARYPGARLRFVPIVPQTHCEAFLRASGFEQAGLSQLEMRWAPS